MKTFDSPQVAKPIEHMETFDIGEALARMDTALLWDVTAIYSLIFRTLTNEAF